MEEKIFSGEMNGPENTEFEIIVNDGVILRGYNVNELIEDAQRMYPDKLIGIRKSGDSKVMPLKNKLL